MPVFTFTSFAEADLFGVSHIAPHATFAMPQTVTLEIMV